MRPPRRLFLTLFVILLLLPITVVPPASATVGRAEPGPRIYLQRTTFDPLAEQPSFRPELMAAPVAGAGGRGYKLVQFAGPILPEWKQAAADAGAELLDYVPDYAFIARLQPGAEQALSALPCVRWVGPFHPAYKVSTALDSALAHPQETGPLELHVRLFQGEDLSAAEAALTRLGALIADRSASSWGGSVRLRLPAAALAAAAQLPAVAWLEPVYPFELTNYVGRATMGVHTAWSRVANLYGSGQMVAVADTGLDTGSLSTISTDFADRVSKTYALGRSGDWSDDDGHGTHVAGSVLGSGALSGSDPATHVYTNSFAGVAPEAVLVFQSVLDSGGGLGGIPADLNTLFQPTYDDGARVHTNSWAAPWAGAYTSDSRNADLFAWNHRDMTILFAAGNEGTDADYNGVVDPDSVAAPGTAKNVITVGASESFRPTGGYNMPFGQCYTWGDCFPDEFAALPISIDPPSNHVGGVAAFSSRGPTDDARIKPDLVAPGTNIISAASHDPDAGTGWGVHDANYLYMGGTSMATPLTAGAAALVREWYNDQQGLASPSSALIKATLINGATTLAPGQYGSAPTQEVPAAAPNNVTGWGRVNLSGSIAPNEPTRLWFEDHTAGLGTGNQATYWFTTSTTLASSEAVDFAGQLVLQPPLPPAAVPRPGSKPGAPPPAFKIPQRIQLPAGATPASANVAAPGEEMVLNGGFETGSLTSWYADGDPPGYQPSAASTQHHSGSYSARLTSGDSQVGRIYQELAFPASFTSATLSFWLRIDGTESWRYCDYFWAAFYRTSGWQLAMPLGYLDAVDRPSGWVQVSYAFDRNAIELVKGQSLYLLFGATTDSSLSSQFYVDDVSLQYETTEPAGKRPFRVTLTWTDYPGAEGSGKTLVNDLDLEVIAPGGARYYGNNASAASPDQRNNVETVWLPDNAPAGTWWVLVKAANVPQATQPYAIVVSGSDLTSVSPPWTSYLFLPLALRQ